MIFVFVGGEEWKPLAEKLGLAPHEIRYLDTRIQNPCEAAISQQRYLNVGALYDMMIECRMPVFADLL